MFRRATHARLCVKTVFMASVPAEGTRFRALRRHAAEAQRQANAAVSGAVQAGQLSRMAAVHQDQGPPHAQHQLPLGASVRSQSPTGRPCFGVLLTLVSV